MDHYLRPVWDHPYVNLRRRANAAGEFHACCDIKLEFVSPGLKLISDTST